MVESDHATRILASDWLRVITRPGYWPLIGLIICGVMDGNLSLRIGGVYLRNNQLTKLDREMFAGLRFADTIDVSGNMIGVVETEVFKELYLVSINMSYNQIERIPAATFIQCDNITLGAVHKSFLCLIRRLMHFI